MLSWGGYLLKNPNLASSIYSEGSKAYIFLLVNTYLTYAAAVRFQDRDRFRRLIITTYIVTLVASIYGIAQFYGTELVWSHALNPYGNRPVSTFGNPNFMSSFMVMVLPVAVADYLFKATALPRAFILMVILAAAGALITTMTRSSWLGGVIAMGVVFMGSLLSLEMREKIRKPLIILAVTLGILTLAWPKSQTGGYSPSPLGRLAEVRQVATGTYGAVTQRLLIWTGAWGMVQDHPILGKGWGCFELFYPFYQGPQMFRRENLPYRTHANNAHNEILEYWSQIGTVGMGIVVLIWLTFFRMGRSMANRLAHPWKSMEWALMGGVAGMLVDNLLNVSAHFAVPGFIFWWWVGSAFALDPGSLQVKKIPLQAGRKKFLLVGATVLLVCLIARSGMMWAGEAYFFEGFKLSKSGMDLPVAKANLETAYALHPLEVNNAYELANVYARGGQRDKALAMYKTALEANAGYDEIWFNRATMFMQLGQDEEAIRHYRIAMAINPTSHEAYNALASIYFKNVQIYGDTAEAMYQQAFKIYPEDKDFWNNLGYLEVQRHKWTEARQAYSRALAIDPNFELARRNLSAVDYAEKHPNMPIAHK
jgi:Tfp pilus assembly protein PilF/O-antigen ligase